MPSSPVTVGVSSPPGVVRLEVDITGEYPHGSAAFTQGLELVDGLVLESVGGLGTSSARTSDLASGHVEREVMLPSGMFAMGITAVPGVGVWQLTWRDGVAFLRDPVTLAVVRQVTYAGEGWGVCFDGTRLVMSDGSDRLVFRDPHTFERRGEVSVVRPGWGSVDQLNELECVDGRVWANVWRKNHIVQIAPSTGQVTAVADIGRIVEIERPTGVESVPNGIAAIPDSDDLLLTGKNYRTTFRARLRADR